MHQGTTIFAQIMDFLPKHKFRKCLDRYSGNYRVRSFSCFDQFMCMAFAQLTYGGTRHSTATALGQLLTPEQIKRGGTGSATNKAFERYFQPRRTESLEVTSAIKQLRKKKKGYVVKFVKKK
jgi:hypothetical protein